MNRFFFLSGHHRMSCTRCHCRLSAIQTGGLVRLWATSSVTQIFTLYHTRVQLTGRHRHSDKAHIRVDRHWSEDHCRRPNQTTRHNQTRKQEPCWGLKPRISPGGHSDDVRCSGGGHVDLNHDAEGGAVAECDVQKKKKKRQEKCHEISVLSNDSARKDKSKDPCG